MDQPTSFFPLLKANSFNSAPYPFIVRPRIIPETPPQVTEAQFEDIDTDGLAEAIATKAPTFLHSITSSVALSNVEPTKVGINIQILLLNSRLSHRKVLHQHMGRLLSKLKIWPISIS